MSDDFQGWMDEVRPPTAADGDWTSSEEGEQALTSLHARLSEDARRARRRRERTARWSRKAWVPASFVAAITAVVVVLSVVGSGGDGSNTSAGGAGRNAEPSTALGGGGSSGGSAGTVEHAPPMQLTGQLLSYASSCGALLTQLRAHAAAHVTADGLPGIGYYGYGSNFSMRVPAASAGSADSAVGGQPSAAPQGGNSTTNNQEVGVDEPDIVKTGNGRVVAITDGVLRVLSSTTGAVTGSLDLTIYSGWESAQLLVDGDNAMVLLGPSSNYTVAPFSTALFVDLAATPTVTGTFRATGGSYLAARLIGDTVRLVVASSPVINFPQAAYGNYATEQQWSAVRSAAAKVNRGIVQQAPLSAWQPTYQMTLAGETVKGTVPCSQIAYPAEFSGESMISVYTLDLAHPSTQITAPVTVAADGDTVYASKQSLYVASNPQWAAMTEGKNPTSNQKTELHRFDIAGSAAPVYLGSTAIPGHLLDQYSLSEYNGTLRAAVTKGNWGDNTSSSVYVLDADTLNTLGHVDGLGKGEQIYAVRFVGAAAYVVTYQQVDPLYVVDLSDPSKPTVTGSLKVSGYSTYLHDAGGGRVIGVGDVVAKDTGGTPANEGVAGGGEPSGLQVSLFDVSDPTTPTRTGEVVLKNSPSWSRLDPHAFLYWQDSGLVVVPVDAWSGTHAGEVLVLNVNGSTLTKIGLVDNASSKTAHDDGLGIQRSLLVNGELWTLSGSGVKITDPATLKQQAWVPFS